MNSNIQAWFDTPIPRKQALTAVLGTWIGTFAAGLIQTRAVIKSAYEHSKSQSDLIEIQKDSIEFLLEKVTPEVHEELDERLDFWRAAHGVPINNQVGD